MDTSLRRPVTELKNKHIGKDLWVLGAAASMQHFEPAFFSNKLTIGVNDVYKHFPCSYLVRKERVNSDLAFASRIPLIMSEFDCGDLLSPRNDVGGEAWYFEHEQNQCDLVDLSVVGTDRIVVSYSTISSAIHVAAYMGASNILICGHDGGVLDGSVTYAGYYTGEVDWDFYRRFVQVVMPQTRQLRNRLREVYGCEVYSMSPFIGLDHEGHEFVV